MTMKKKILIGFTGAGFFAFIDFFNTFPYVFEEFADIRFLFGYLVKLFLILAASTIAVFMYDSDDIKLLFHLSIATPALFIALIAGSITMTIATQIEVSSTTYQAHGVIRSAAASQIEQPVKPKVERSQFLEGLGVGRQRTAGRPIEANFRLIFFSIIGLTLFSALANMYLVSVPAHTDAVRSATEGFSTTWKLGFGAVVGLIGGIAA